MMTVMKYLKMMKIYQIMIKLKKVNMTTFEIL